MAALPDGESLTNNGVFFNVRLHDNPKLFSFRQSFDGAIVSVSIFVPAFVGLDKRSDGFSRFLVDGDSLGLAAVARPEP